MSSRRPNENWPKAQSQAGDSGGIRNRRANSSSMRPSKAVATADKRRRRQHASSHALSPNLSRQEHGPAARRWPAGSPPRQSAHRPRGRQSHLDAALRPAAGGQRVRLRPQRQAADASGAARLAGRRVDGAWLEHEAHASADRDQQRLSHAIAKPRDESPNAAARPGQSLCGGCTSRAHGSRSGARQHAVRGRRARSRRWAGRSSDSKHAADLPRAASTFATTARKMQSRSWRCSTAPTPPSAIAAARRRAAAGAGAGQQRSVRRIEPA